MVNVKIIVAALAVLALTACAGPEGGDGRSAADAMAGRRTVKSTPAPQSIAAPQVNPGPTALPVIGEPMPTETPDLGPEPAPQVNPGSTPLPVDVGLALIEQYADLTPTPAQVATCDPNRVGPLVTPDASDVAAGVVVRGFANCPYPNK